MFRSNDRGVGREIFNPYVNGSNPIIIWSRLISQDMQSVLVVKEVIKRHKNEKQRSSQYVERATFRCLLWWSICLTLISISR